MQLEQFNLHISSLEAMNPHLTSVEGLGSFGTHLGGCRVGHAYFSSWYPHVKSFLALPSL